MKTTTNTDFNTTLSALCSLKNGCNGERAYRSLEELRFSEQVTRTACKTTSNVLGILLALSNDAAERLDSDQVTLLGDMIGASQTALAELTAEHRELVVLINRVQTYRRKLGLVAKDELVDIDAFAFG